MSSPAKHQRIIVLILSKISMVIGNRGFASKLESARLVDEQCETLALR